MRIGTRAVGWVGGAVVLTLLVPPGARAQVVPGQGGPEGTITATGTAGVERRPELIRMQVDLSASGKDAREALANLRAQEKGARDKLAKVGAAGEAVKLGDPRVAPAGGNNRQAQLNQMIAGRLGRGGRAAPATAPAQPKVTVSATLKVEWKLKSQTADDLLVEAQDLQAKVKAADLVAGSKAAKTPEEQEEAEEAAAMAMGNMESNPEEVVFLYVSKLTDEDRAKATAEAFGKAQAEAARLAKAAGRTAGPLRQLSSQAGSDFGQQQNGMDYSNPYGRMLYGLIQRQQAGTAEAAEAVGIQPGEVNYRVVVSASFQIQ